MENCDNIAIRPTIKPYASQASVQTLADMVYACCSSNCIRYVPTSIEKQSFCAYAYPDGVPDPADCPILTIIYDDYSDVFFGHNPEVCSDYTLWTKPTSVPLSIRVGNTPHNNAAGFSATQLAGTVVPIAWNDVEWEYSGQMPDSMFDIASPTLITVPVRGFYYVNGNLEVQGDAGAGINSQWMLNINANNTYTPNITLISGNNQQHFAMDAGWIYAGSINGSVMLNAGDSISMSCQTFSNPPNQAFQSGSINRRDFSSNTQLTLTLLARI